MTRTKALEVTRLLTKIESIESFMTDFEDLCSKYEQDEINEALIDKINSSIDDEYNRLKTELADM